MTLKEFIDKLLRRQPASAETAKERLQLVLAHDRSDLNPELLEHCLLYTSPSPRD